LRSRRIEVGFSTYQNSSRKNGWFLGRLFGFFKTKDYTNSPNNELAEGLERSQVDEYLEFYEGAGV
jgi:hypothetical protein